MTSEMMNAVVADSYGGSDVLSVRSVAVPAAAKGEVQIRVEAASLNALDWHFLTGTPYVMRIMAGLRRPKRTIPGADVAGVIVAVGPGVTDLHVGDAVFGESPGGGCAEYLVLNASKLVKKPDAVSFQDAGATPVAGLTALQGLCTHAKLQSGDAVLINGAAGGVGTFAVQIAKALGAKVTAVCSTRNVEMVKALGADTVIDYTVDDFVRRGGQFDVMFDNVGNRTPAECLSLLRPSGRYVLTTGPKTNRWLGPIPHIVRSAAAFLRADPSFHQFTASANRDDLTILADFLASGAVKPSVQRVIGLDGVAEGLREISSGHARAKIVVVPN